MFGLGLDYCRSILHDGKGAAFVPSPASGELLPFGYQVIELTGYSDMWGEYRDFLHCKVIQFLTQNSQSAMESVHGVIYFSSGRCSC